MHLKTYVLMFLIWCAPLTASNEGVREDVIDLKRQVARQQREIDELKASVSAQKALLDRLLAANIPPVSSLAEVKPGRGPAPVAEAGQAPQAGVKVEELARETQRVSHNLGGFAFSGDFRYRLDLQLRSGNEIAPPLQNARARYRVRLNIDKGIDRQVDPKLRFHMQLSTGPYSTPNTNDQDFAGLAVKHPFSISEAFLHYRPTNHLALRAGRMEEVFAENMRFLWDDDVRFNGFQQVLTVPLENAPLGIKSIEFRAGEYILSNPNIAILGANSPYVAAGYAVGQKVRSAALFHPGAIVRGDLGSQWSHQFLADMSLYRNPNQIQLASTSSGFPPLVGNPIGVQLPHPPGGTGTATTSPGGAMYTARHFQIAHAGYRLERKGIRLGGREMPLWFDFQASRNVGTSSLRDAVMASANLGSVRRFGDVRFLYQYAIKDANALISQFTDDDLGTQTGVNIAVHALRFDFGLTRYLQWQNLLFVQNQRRASNPSDQLFVVLERGANPTIRFLGQLAFTF